MMLFKDFFGRKEQPNKQNYKKKRFCELHAVSPHVVIKGKCLAWFRYQYHLNLIAGIIFLTVNDQEFRNKRKCVCSRFLPLKRTCFLATVAYSACSLLGLSLLIWGSKECGLDLLYMENALWSLLLWCGAIEIKLKLKLNIEMWHEREAIMMHSVKFEK